MATFAKTVVLKDDYKEKEERNGMVVYRFDAVETGDTVECVETVVPKGTKQATVKAEYEAWKAAAEAAALETAKQAKSGEINAYDVSDAVNSFTLKHEDAAFDYWLPAVTRNQLVTSVTTWSAKHDTYTLDLREYGTSVDINCAQLLGMLSELENYAVECYNVTSTHLAAVGVLKTVEEVEAYDITADYPAKMVFEV